MNNLIVMPMVIPLLTGVLLIFYRKFTHRQRWITFSFLLVNAGISLFLLQQIQRDGIITLDFGGWMPPFGILFFADSFAMLLVLTTNIVSAICVLFAMRTMGV